MLERRHRLTESAGFVAATRRGRRAGTRTLVLHLGTAPHPPGGETAAGAAGGGDGVRIGFVVSRAVGGAVVRNRVKRRLRHLVRSRIDTLPPDAVLVVRALPAAAEASGATLERDLDAALSRLAGPATGSRTGSRTGSATGSGITGGRSLVERSEATR
jgi:ribonuclease P protein component